MGITEKDILKTVLKVPQLEEQLDTKANKDDVARISSGTPLFASSVSGMTDITKNYVNTSDGYLYTYSNGAWTKTTVQYQSTGIADGSITPTKTTFINAKTQYLSHNNIVVGKRYVHGGIAKVDSANTCIYEGLQIKKGMTYYYKYLYAYFSTLQYNNGVVKAVSEDAYNSEGSFVAESDGVLWCCCSKSDYDKNLLTLICNTNTFPNKSIVGDYSYNIPNLQIETSFVKRNIITVKKDGTGDFIKITEAVNSIVDSSQTNVYDIHIYSGIYNIVEELGGQTWVNSVSHSNGERQGLLLPDYVNLLGHGSVYIDCIVENENAMSDFAKSVSTINVYKNNELEGITFRAKNTRYAIHDETNNSFHNLYRKIKNCRFIHYGTIKDYWYACKAMGGGLGSGGRYDIENSHFESTMIPFSYHNNANQDSNYINLDGCTFSGNRSTHQYDIGFGYYKNNTEKAYVTIKNCTSDRGVLVYEENGVADNVFVINEIGNKIRTA